MTVWLSKVKPALFISLIWSKVVTFLPWVKVRMMVVGGGHLVLKKRIDDSIEIFDAIIKGQPDKFLPLWVLRS